MNMHLKIAPVIFLASAMLAQSVAATQSMMPPEPQEQENVVRQKMRKIKEWCKEHPVLASVIAGTAGILLWEGVGFCCKRTGDGKWRPLNALKNKLTKDNKTGTPPQQSGGGGGRSDGQIYLADGSISTDPVARDFVVESTPFKMQEIGSDASIKQEKVNVELKYPRRVHIKQLPGLAQRGGADCTYYALYFFWCLETGRMDKILDRAYYDECEHDWTQLIQKYRAGTERAGKLDFLADGEVIHLASYSKFLKECLKVDPKDGMQWPSDGLWMTRLGYLQDYQHNHQRWKLENNVPKCFMVSHGNHAHTYKAEINTAGGIELTAVHSMGWDIRNHDVTQEFACSLAFANQKD